MSEKATVDVVTEWILHAPYEELERMGRAMEARRRQLATEEKAACLARQPKDGTPSLARGVTYAHEKRCRCGAGLVISNDDPKGIHGAWECSRVFFATAEEHAKFTPALDQKASVFAGCAKEQDGSLHDLYPFAYYEIKSEFQPSAAGVTTRPGPLKPVQPYGTLECMHLLDRATGMRCPARFAPNTDHALVEAHAKTHQEEK